MSLSLIVNGSKDKITIKGRFYGNEKVQNTGQEKSLTKAMGLLG